MQPDEDQQYWKKDSDPEELTETYTPTDEEADSVYDDADPESDNRQSVLRDDGEPIHWSAYEYIDEERNGMWFVLFILAAVGLIALDIFIFKSISFSILVVVMAITIVIYSRRPPKIIDYTLSGNQGLYVGDKLYHFSEFKSFGVIKDREHHSIMLVPIKRFSPGLSVYFPEESGEAIVDIMGARLPMEPLKLDFIDHIVRKLRL